MRCILLYILIPLHLLPFPSPSSFGVGEEGLRSLRSGTPCFAVLTPPYASPCPFVSSFSPFSTLLIRNPSLLLPRIFPPLQMPNLSTLELSELRPFFTLSFLRLSQLSPDADRLRETEEWWMRDPGGCMDAARRGELSLTQGEGGYGREGREGTVSEMGGY